MVSSSRLFLGQLAVWLLAISNAGGDIVECQPVRQVFPDCSCEEAIDDKGLQLLLPVVDCSERGLTQVPVPSDTYNKQIYEIRLNNNSITSLGSDIFNGLQVRKIDLSGNAVSSVDNNTFRALTDHLLILHMDGDSISPPPKAAFTKLSNVEELVLRKFKVLNLEFSNDQSYFLHFPKLKYLTLDNWGILSIDPNSFQGPTQLLSLSLLNQELPALPVDELQSAHLKSLRSLTVKHNPLNDITPFIFSGLDNIEIIDLSSNYIDRLEADCFANVGDTLTTLHLAHNRLQESNQLTGLRSLSQLQELDLSSNLFNTIPNLSQLNTTKPQLKLYLNNNQITTLPANAFSGIANVLTTVDLSHNGIASIDDNVFQGMINLEVLSMVDSAHSPAVQSLILPSSLTQSKNTLKQLNFSGQKFTTSSLWSVVGQLSGLEVLDLAQNQLTSISDLALQALTSLQSLDLSQNSLRTLTQRSLVGPRNTLKHLYLGNNAITGLPSCLFYNYTSYPISLTLTNNPLNCTCDLKWLWMEVRNKRIVFPLTHEAKCSDNQLLANKTEAELCSTPHTDSACEEYYTTLAPIASTPRPDPGLSIFFDGVTTTSITVRWSLSETDGLTSFKVEVSSSYSSSEFSKEIKNPAQRQETATGLMANVEHQVCVTAYFATENNVQCDKIRTAADNTTPSGLSDDDDSEDVGIIIGAVIGGVVLLAIVVAIVYLVFIRRHPKKGASNNVPSQPRNFSKAELPSMSPDTRSFARPRGSAGNAAVDHGDGMQVVAISDGQTSNGRVGRAQMLTSDGSYKVMRNNNKSSSRTSGQSYENDRPSLPPIPPSHAPPSYYNDAFEDDRYDKVEPPKVVTEV